MKKGIGIIALLTIFTQSYGQIERTIGDTLIVDVDSLTAIKLAKLVPSGYNVVGITIGDLNKDGIEDTVLIIKGTDKKMFLPKWDYDTSSPIVDKNRRGLIIRLSNGERLQNSTCFSSENEDGGNYFAPELKVYIEKGNLYIRYLYGRYGGWEYTFRYKNYGNYSDFQLIGYDEDDNRGPVTESMKSINFLTKKIQTDENTNPYAESGEEVFKETRQDISIDKLLRLSKITDFDNLNLEDYYSIKK